MGLGTAAAEESELHADRKPIPSPEELKKLPKDGGPEFNRLVFEKSPYLLQHARNPVDWYPWGEEAFKKARDDDKPVFLSIGYSTCHWCHVMEQESFQDKEVADLLNKHFVPVKVDREERPDIDRVYMTVVELQTGSGGWPMTVLMTPDAKPFFARTYVPKRGRLGRPGLLDLLSHFGEAWKRDRRKLLEAGDAATAALAKATTGSPGPAPAEKALHTAYDQLAAGFDREYGGFGGAPKFPAPHTLSFLLRYWKRTGKADALEMAEKTLTAVRRGAIYDQIGFGVHRYAEDRAWVAPHFEKTLYDQALLAMANIEAFQATGKEDYARTAREVFTYVLRDMTSPEGGFYSAEDADSEGEEGRFYLWRPQELREILGQNLAALIIRTFDVSETGNFLDPATEKTTGKSVFRLKEPLDQVATETGIPPEELQGALHCARRLLLDVRGKRVRPLRDDKILADWNGLMIAALAKGTQALNAPEYAQAARKAADFILANVRRPDGRLLKRHCRGEAGLPAHLDDYAFLVWGLLELYEATFEVRYLREALVLQGLMLKHFWDDKAGGLFLTADDGEKLLVRSKVFLDGAIPSGNSVAALNLFRLARITGNTDYAERAEAILKAFASPLGTKPYANAQLLAALDFLLGPSFEVVIAGKPDSQDTKEMLRALRRPFVPNKVVLFRPDDQEDPPICEVAPFTKVQTSIKGAATAYVCRDFACKQPTTDIGAMLDSLVGPR
jgi:uncharacterized protein YyaL (SSP411 family)